jgi:hypothetical protein
MPTFPNEMSPELLKTTAPLTKKSNLLAGGAAASLRNIEIKAAVFSSRTPVALKLNTELMLDLPQWASSVKVGFHNSPVKPARVELRPAPAGRFTAPCAIRRNAD